MTCEFRYTYYLKKELTDQHHTEYMQTSARCFLANPYLGYDYNLGKLESILLLLHYQVSFRQYGNILYIPIKRKAPEKKSSPTLSIIKASEKKLLEKAAELCQIHTKRLLPGREARGPSRAG